MGRKIPTITALLFILLMTQVCLSSEKQDPLSFEERHKDKQFIYLLADVDVKVNEDWTYVTRSRERIKILKEEARSLGEISIPYEEGRETVSEVKAYTVTPDNKKLPYSTIQDLSMYAGYPMYSNFKVKIITLPEVVVGAVLEYEYALTSKGMPIRNTFWYEGNAESDAPVKEFRFSITMPKKLGIQYREFGMTRKPKITEKDSAVSFVWDVREMEPSTLDEDYTPPPTPQDARDRFEFSSLNEWKEISHWYLSLAEKNLKITEEIEEASKKIAGDSSSVEGKTRAILEYISANFRYVSMTLDDHTLEPHPTDETFKNKYGDCKDLSLLAMAMLRSAGIDSHMALFNTEFSGMDPKHCLPLPGLFNHVVLLVKGEKGKDFYVDPSLEGYDVGQYPLTYQAAHTFLITEEGGGFERFPVSEEKNSSCKTRRIVTIYGNGSALTEVEQIGDLDFSVFQRKLLKGLDKEKKHRFFQALDAGLASGGKLIERRIEGLDNKYGPITLVAKTRRDGEFPVTNGMIIIDIPGYDRSRGFATKERKNPIFWPANARYERITTYRIPKGFKILHMPGDLNLDVGLFSLTRKYVRTGGSITATEMERRRRMQLPKEKYADVKQFFDQLRTKTSQRIILKK
ncbi:MAG: DUF3857 and transglutaminase domain-containing protein [Armatimonadetes bacterium]|nr:DUF3857 and transglutaminase domain-containing protein [Armatimonadota bacterium]